MAIELGNIPIIWVNCNDLTVRPSPGIMAYCREIIPFKKAELFRLVKSFNLPRIIQLGYQGNIPMIYQYSLSIPMV